MIRIPGIPHAEFPNKSAAERALSVIYREAYHAARARGLDVGEALDDAGQEVAALLGDLTCFLDSETLTVVLD